MCCACNIISTENLTCIIPFCSYLNIFEERDLAIERRFFEAHPELGKFDNTVIVGTILPPPQKYPDFIKVGDGLES